MPAGGKRKGAGRKSQYGEPTTTVAFRIPTSLVPQVKDYINQLNKSAMTTYTVTLTHNPTSEIVYQEEFINYQKAYNAFALRADQHNIDYEPTGGAITAGGIGYDYAIELEVKSPS